MHNTRLLWLAGGLLLGLTGGLLWTYGKCSSFFAPSKERVSAGAPASYSLETALKYDNIIPIAIIGSGPAGLSAALYGARANIYTVVFQGSKPGGQLTGTTHIENWPGAGRQVGPELMENISKHAASFGAQIVHDTVVKADFSSWPFTLTTEEGKKVHALSVIIATGSTPRTLGVEGESKYWAHGVSTCAVCDAPFYKDAAVVVVGGGDSAMEEALQLAPYAGSVTVLVRGDRVRASAVMFDRIKDFPNIKVQFNTHIERVEGDGTYVNNIAIVTNGVPSMMPIDGVFLAIGHEPNSDLFRTQVATDAQGYVALDDRTQKTNIPGVFAAGDVADHHYRQAGVAAGDGIKAALDATEFLRTIGFVGDVAAKFDASFFDAQEGKVKAELMSLVTKDDFEKRVLASPLPVVVDFYAPWCPTCMQMLPVVQWVAGKLKDKVIFAKVDVSQSKELAELLVVPTVPTMLVYKNGSLVARNKNIMNKKELLAFVQDLIK